MKKIKLLTLLFAIITSVSFSQNQTTSISVTGTASYNLSPNEIIIKISYQEYFKTTDEKLESKIPIEEIEKQVLKSLETAGIKKDKITMGEASLVQPYKNGVLMKSRVNKTAFICIDNSDNYIKLIRQLEKDNLMDNIIQSFGVDEYRHTDKEKYLTKCRAEAFANAKTKAELILSQSNQKVGKIITVKEVSSQEHSSKNGFYSTDNFSNEKTSGFKPVIISYTLDVTFEIL